MYRIIRFEVETTRPGRRLAQAHTRSNKQLIPLSGIVGWVGVLLLCGFIIQDLLGGFSCVSRLSAVVSSELRLVSLLGLLLDILLVRWVGF